MQASNFDPTDRIDIDITTEDNSSVIASKIYSSIKGNHHYYYHYHYHHHLH